MSKRVFNHPPEAEGGRKYWRSLGQLAKTPESRKWIEREFPEGAANFPEGEVSRRGFLQIMGASAALAGLSLAACRREKHLVPFSKGVEWSIPGKALFFATSMPTKRGAQPLVVTTFDGRPTKIEGNPMHPAVKGATNTWAQASVLDLYDPDRSRDFLQGGKKSDSATFEKALDEFLSKAGDGSSVAFLLEKNPSPTRERLRAEIEKKLPKSIWCVYEPTGGDGAAAATAAFGDGLSAVPNLDKADVILAVDSDFLSCSEGDVETIRQFSARRKVDGPQTSMNRLYVAENRFTITGGMADHRIRVAASQAGLFLSAIARQIPADPGLTQLLAALKAPPNHPFDTEWVKYAAADLVAAKGRSLVLVGERQPAIVQLLGYAINAALGNLGRTLLGRKVAEKPAVGIDELAKKMGEKSIHTLFIVGGNPVYNAPADLDWAAKQANVANVVRLGLHEDETTKNPDGKPLAAWHVPLAHYLESWGDSTASDGSYTSVQPMILPLYGGWSELDLLAKVAGQQRTDGPELVQETFRQVTSNAPGFVAAWAKFLHDGFLAGSAPKPETLSFNAATAAEYGKKHLKWPDLGDGAFELVFVADAKVDDGRYANNGWLQELPDPITKLTWDNAAWVSPKTAAEVFKIKSDEGGYEADMKVRMLNVTVGDTRESFPILVVPGAADNSITIPLGYGRSVVGRVGRGMEGSGGTGRNAYPLRTTQNPYFVTNVTVAVDEDEEYYLAVTQEHSSLEGRGADLTREAVFDVYKDVASAAESNVDTKDYFKKAGDDKHTPLNQSLYSHPELENVHQWGMNIDLNNCTGCSACMVACQAENNIPIVGKDQVIGNREMHWIRTDRYWTTTDANPDNPEMVSQPMLCQHCENAPCETVCPVNATVHSDDGINTMAYNRCIGTRYCANNCPFKVRRFNFFDYNQRDVLGHKEGHPFSGLYKWNLIADKSTPETIKLQKNPNVTVRMRGVMEKCTFCIQRVQEAKIAAKAHARDSEGVPRIPTDAFTTACAQVCPTGAIVFGDIKNPNSEVSKIRARERRGYNLLEYLNLSTRVLYLARIRNPNPKMPDASRLAAFMVIENADAKPASAINGGQA